ncbi:hypothetical protein OESDEN_04028 [Oesophagostomum dentatum]|uniref:Uncharacterized protein n=1 Tax=Oesophagostomum dentatum TaxID=61180 RepID=A0A0B1TJL5_OESDE|nr:hypothetical protein OESDEN_04028 [Oesophagostomum dentatum]
MESSSGSTEVDSTTYASSEFSDGDLADVICDQLEEMGIDVYMMEDEDLIREMSSAVKTLKGPTNSTAARRLRLLIAHDRITTDYLFNLDVTPIKRRLNVISSDLTRAVAVMRSDCDVDTLLDAMRGGCVSEPSAKRLKSEEVKAETKRRVEALLKQLAEQRHATNEEQGTLAEATSAEPDPDGAKEWFDGEDGPSTSAPTEISENAAGNLDEEARLDAIVQSKVRSHIEKAAARRHALKSKKQRVSAQQAEHSVLQRTEAHTHIHATSPLNVGIFDDDDALLSFDSPYMEESFANDSALDFTPKEPSVSVSLQHLERGTLSPPHDAHATTVDPSNTHASDNVDLDLFDGFDFLF